MDQRKEMYAKSIEGMTEELQSFRKLEINIWKGTGAMTAPHGQPASLPS